MKTELLSLIPRSRHRDTQNIFESMSASTPLKRQSAKKRLTFPLGAAVVAAPMLFALLPTSMLSQTASQASPAQSTAVPVWQTAAGGKMSFEVASIRQSKPGAESLNNGELDFSNTFPSTGGLLTVRGTLLVDIIFAYKIVDATQNPYIEAQLPEWAKTEMFDIRARSEDPNPTKDQMRLMMQSLLADRFGLRMHLQTRQLPVYALVLKNPGRPGPQLQPHPAGVPCTGESKPAKAPSGDPAPATPAFCGAVVASTVDGQRHFKMSDVTMSQIAAFFAVMGSAMGGLDSRPVLDRTGLTGNFDFEIQFLPESHSPRPPDADALPEPPGPTLTEALKTQLGLKLIKQEGPVEVYVIDHVEKPSDN